MQHCRTAFLKLEGTSKINLNMSKFLLQKPWIKLLVLLVLKVRSHGAATARKCCHYNRIPLYLMDLLVSTYVVCERLLWCISLLEWLKFWSKFYRIPLFWNTVSENPPPKMKIVRDWSGWNFGPNSTEYPYSEIQFQNTPPPENENCQRSWHFDFSVSESPPRKLKFGQILALWLFSFRIPPLPRKLKFGQILALCTHPPTPPPSPRKLKFGQILALWFFSFRIPPPQKNWNLGRSCHFKTFQFQNYVWQVTTCGDFIQPG